MMLSKDEKEYQGVVSTVKTYSLPSLNEFFSHGFMQTVFKAFESAVLPDSL